MFTSLILGKTIVFFVKEVLFFIVLKFIKDYEETSIFGVFFKGIFKYYYDVLIYGGF